MLNLLLKYPPLPISKRWTTAHALIATAPVFPADTAKSMFETDLSAAVCFPAMLALKDDGEALFGVVETKII